MPNNDDLTVKIGFLYGIVVVLLLIFLARVLYLSVHQPSTFFTPITTKKDLATRGSIISSDNYILAKSRKIYNVAVIGKYINKNKKQLLINLLSIYSSTPKSIIQKALSSEKRVVLLRNIPYEVEKNLKYLSEVLTLKKVFLPTKRNIIYGLDIYEKHPQRIYPFKNTLEPVLGYLGENKQHKKQGMMGLEKYYNSVLQPIQNGLTKGYQDVRGNIIYDNSAIIKPRINGYNLHLNINLVLQKKIENMLDEMKKQLKAKEIITIVMQSKTGKIIAIASSNRYNPNNITKSDIPKLKISAIQYTYEPGSVMKPITLALLLKHRKVNLYELINAHNGVYHFKKNFTIYDDEPFKWLSVTQAVIHSSNIVFVQLGLRLTPQEFRNGLLNFGFDKKSWIDLPYGYKGEVFSLQGFQSDTHRASNAFGYAIRVTLVQLLQAYNVFNNEGVMVSPRIAQKYNNTPIPIKTKQIISPVIAQSVLNVLRKVVLRGTAVGAQVDGIWTAGKTGTAKISENNKYKKGFYNSSFIGFANDKTHKYTIATLTIKPDPKYYFASQTSVKVFRNIVTLMVDMNLLKPSKNKEK
jgi:cell division protein FtsI (penicillin-binding protein 3)